LSTNYKSKDVSNIFTALGNPIRMKIISILFSSKKPLHIAAISRALKFDYVLIYRHVKVLERNKLVEIYDVGRSRVISPSNPDLIKSLIELANKLK